MFVKVKGAFVELLHEEPKSEAGNGLMIVFGILMFTFGIAAAVLASI